MVNKKKIKKGRRRKINVFIFNVDRGRRYTKQSTEKIVFLNVQYEF